MTRILLVSDTHGNLSQLESLIRKTEADAVIHAGDFGFYDNESVNRLQTRELRLLVTHSAFKEHYLITKETKREHLIEIIQKHKLLGDFSDYLEGKKTFSVPIYAIWGNHEDLSLVERLRKEVTVRNLFLLDEQHFYEIEGGIMLYGIGGNWLPGKKLFDPPLAGAGGKIWGTLSQFGSLYKKLKKHKGASLFVSHVSPGKEPLLVRLMNHFSPNFWISGHMGAPYPCLWNPFTVRNEGEQREWLSRDLPLLENVPEQISEDAKLAYDLIQKPLPPLENWYRKQWCLNLPDADDGHAILLIDHHKLSLQTYASGVSC